MSPGPVLGSLCRSGLLACSLLLFAAPGAPGNQSSTQISQSEIAQSVVSSLLTQNGESANIAVHLDLTSPFDTQAQWTFVAAILRGSHIDGAIEEPVKGGPLTQCFVHDLRPKCTYTAIMSSNLDYSIPIELHSAELVFRGASSTRPLLMIKTGGSQGGDGDHYIYTELFSYDR